MGRYLLIRIAGFIGVLLVVSLLTFVLMHSVPGGPFEMKLGEKITAVPPAVIEAWNHLYGLDKPILVQYWVFLKNVVHFNFGPSFFWTSQNVQDIIIRQWPYTIQLGLMTMIFGGAIGLALGILAAVRQNSWIDS